MDGATRLSTGAVVDTTTMTETIHMFEMLWVSRFGYPEAVVIDKAFDNDEFSAYIKSAGINKLSVPARRHNKNVLESKHKVLRDIFQRLSYNDTVVDTVPHLRVQHMYRVGNLLYGNDCTSAFELAHGVSPNLLNNEVVKVPPDILEAHNQLKAQLKLKRILKSKSTTDRAVAEGDVVVVYIKRSNEKRGKWTNAKKVLQYDPCERYVTYAGKNGRTANAAVEDIRLSLQQDSLAKHVEDAIAELSNDIDWSINAEVTSIPATQQDEQRIYDDAPCHLGDEDVYDDVFNTDVSTNPNLSTVAYDLGEESSTQPSTHRTPDVEDVIDVYWSGDENFYSGVVSKFNPRTRKHTINYEDGDVEVIGLRNKRWKPHKEPLVGNKQEVGCDVQLTPVGELTSKHAKYLQTYHDVFASREFNLTHAQGLQQCVLDQAYNSEEASQKGCGGCMFHVSPHVQMSSLVTHCTRLS